MSTETSDSCFSKFYAEMRRQDEEPTGKSALNSFRYAIERYLNGPPHNKGISLACDEAFKRSTKVLVSILRKQRREGYDKVQHKSVTGEGDMKLLRSSGVFGKDTPLSLLRGVWFHVAFHCCRRGREGLRALTSKSFEMVMDDTGHRYYKMTREELMKNHPGGLGNDENYEADIQMYNTNDENDCFHLLEFYLTKVNPKCPSLFQYPAAAGNFHEILKCGLKIDH